MTRRQIMFAAIWLLIVVGVPLLGHLARESQSARCAFDGQPIVPIYRVRVERLADDKFSFCCLECARRWLEGHAGNPRVLVTDETSGREIPASEAIFVRSQVVTTSATGNRVHAFANQADAQRHAESSNGQILIGARRPFAQDTAEHKLSTKVNTQSTAE
ncbi:MAG: hypothetical protein AB7O62_02880 [Pirellulales bacterium]